MPDIDNIWAHSTQAAAAFSARAADLLTANIMNFKVTAWLVVMIYIFFHKPIMLISNAVMSSDVS